MEPLECHIIHTLIVCHSILPSCILSVASVSVVFLPVWFKLVIPVHVNKSPICDTVSSKNGNSLVESLRNLSCIPIFEINFAIKTVISRNIPI